MSVSIDRRSFLTRAVGTALIPGSVAGLVAACAETDIAGAVVGPRLQKVKVAGPGTGGYGALMNSQGPVLLPKGFHARVVSRIGDPMSDGAPTPISFDAVPPTAVPIVCVPWK